MELEKLELGGARIKLYFLQEQRTFGRGLPDHSLWRKLQEVLGIRLLHVWERRIPPNVLVADFASGQGGLSCTVQWSDRPWQPRQGGGRCCPQWSLLVSALICRLSCSSICGCVLPHFVCLPGGICAGPNGHFTLVSSVLRSGRLLFQFICISVLLYYCR